MIPELGQPEQDPIIIKCTFPSFSSKCSYLISPPSSCTVGLILVDYANRCVRVDSFWRLSGQMHADLAVFARRLADGRGLRHHLAAPVRPL